MNIERHRFDLFSPIHNFFFHPFHRKKEEKRKTIAAVIMNLFLSTITGGLWLVPFSIVNRRDFKKVTNLEKDETEKTSNVSSNNFNTRSRSQTNETDNEVPDEVDDSSSKDNTKPPPPGNKTVDDDSDEVDDSSSEDNTKPPPPGNKTVDDVSNEDNDSSTDEDVSSSDEDNESSNDNTVPNNSKPPPGSNETDGSRTVRTTLTSNVLEITNSTNVTKEEILLRINQNTPIDLTLEEDLVLLYATNEELNKVAESYKPLVMKANIKATCILGQIRILQQGDGLKVFKTALCFNSNPSGNSKEMLEYLKSLRQKRDLLNQETYRSLSLILKKGTDSEKATDFFTIQTDFNRLFTDVGAKISVAFESNGLEPPYDLIL